MDHPIASTSSNRSADPAIQEEVGALGNVGELSGTAVTRETAAGGRPADLIALFSSGYMKICPYDSNHIVRETRFSKHLMKCRHTFVTSHAEEGREVLMLPCRYNSEHQALAQELAYHVEFCPDKEQVGRLQTLLDGSTDDEEDVALADYGAPRELEQEEVAPNQPEESPQADVESVIRPVRYWRLGGLAEPTYVPVENFTVEAMADDGRLSLPQNEDSSWYDWFRDPFFYGRQY